MVDRDAGSDSINTAMHDVEKILDELILEHIQIVRGHTVGEFSDRADILFRVREEEGAVFLQLPIFRAPVKIRMNEGCCSEPLHEKLFQMRGDSLTGAFGQDGIMDRKPQIDCICHCVFTSFVIHNNYTT